MLNGLLPFVLIQLATDALSLFTTNWRDGVGAISLTYSHATALFPEKNPNLPQRTDVNSR